ncbi:RagB/SusD family nutrient uptake outer membrane protein [Niabella sp. 22666]|uniref:RagB/SusD family nutrient uptake outer membrane protein n=1 Tax=Niabella sp. 22666 TaxID=3453954 RepID=UPI003F834C6B
MIKTNHILICLLALTLFSSCKKWLDLQPESQISEDVLFTTEEGFKEALIGIYTRCTRTDIYGKELTIGTPEVLAQNYSISANDPLRYLKTKAYDYKDPNFISRKDDIWKGLYNAIVNCNLILGKIDEKKNLFMPGNYELIKGEALGLRAYLHFDALRLFAPSFASNPNAAAIPYVTQYSNKTTPLSTVTQVLDSAIFDLERAKQLLNRDLIRSAAYRVGYPTQTDTTLNTEEGARDLFLHNRRHRLNYYAVCGTLARVQLYKNNKPQALANAQEVISANKFPWTKAEDFLAVDEDKKDLMLYKELVFSWFIPTLDATYNSSWFSGGVTGMHLTQEASQEFYETGTVGSNDMRYKQWFTTVNNQTSYISEIHKYRRNSTSTTSTANLAYMVAPAIRLSEMYFIAAECSYAANPAAATAFIDEVRSHRGIGEKVTVANETALRNELLKEYRKDLFGEGQLFYAFKRWNVAISGQNGTSYPASNNIFVLPLPDDEIIYGNR